RRLNLTRMWIRNVPMDGKRDAIIYILLDRNDLIVLTRSGQVARLDAETGRQYWRTRGGKAYTLLPFVTANARSIYVIANAYAHALDRTTGTQKWEARMRAGISAPPIADEQLLFVPLATGRLNAFALPFAGVGVDPATGEAEGKSESLIYGKVTKIE